MRRAVLLVAAGALALGAGVAWWRRHPRSGSGWVNRVVNPWLVRSGAFEGARGELGLLEHVGRKSGMTRISPVHPVRTPDGYRIVVPLGLESHWARNVLAAGHCRLQVGEVVAELDEPRLVGPAEIETVPAAVARAMEWLGFRYLVLRQFAERPGTLEVEGTAPAPTEAHASSEASAPAEAFAEPLPTA